MLTSIDRIAGETARTSRIAGSIEEGRITYVTRSAFWGFPDYTTVAAVPVDGGTSVAILGRARFGRSDLGVNRKRIEGWLDALS